jgi:DNA-binding CsgD family transcriptional regulator
MNHGIACTRSVPARVLCRSLALCRMQNGAPVSLECLPPPLRAVGESKGQLRGPVLLNPSSVCCTTPIESTWHHDASVQSMCRPPRSSLILSTIRLESLSPREREIVIQVARGRLSKQIAGDMGITEPTVKVHRSRAMRKMNARSLSELGRMADKLKLVPEEQQTVLKQ